MHCRASPQKYAPFARASWQGPVFQLTSPALQTMSDTPPVVVATPVGLTATDVATRPDPWMDSRKMLEPSTGTNQWSTGMFQCFSGKDCCSPNGCIQNCFCGLCVYSSAIALSGVDPIASRLDEQARCLGVCVGICCEVVPCQGLMVRVIARLAVAKKCTRAAAPCL